ncbi:hypothetical protein JOY44_21500 [Phormidium sp. CLA17]|uniref:hypothetical protein n=1 Tax=Leptolyngbya sp. Cla-17 TaxID=2803751 RepID=UPI0014913A3B|nr:hypothetical protein [Leptolyngbya sp. Cla-17]MBM0744158.1 hypothetical protein [Leptolyngbya sp. Cla-17]
MKYSPTKPFRAWFTNLQHHIFRDWSAAKTERNRRALNQAIIRAENELCQARMRVIAIPRQTETTQVLLDEFLSYEAIQQVFEETNKGSLLAQLQAKRDALSQQTSPDQTDENGAKTLQKPANSNPQVLQALNLLERAIKQLDEFENAQTIQTNAALKFEIESAKQLLQRVQAVRDDFIKSQENPSILCDELNHLQLMLSQMRYEVTNAQRLSTLKRFGPKIEQISQVAKSVSSDQVGVVYLVASTSLEVERWLCRYQWNLASLPTGWFLGYFVNRFRDVTRLIGRVSGIKGAQYSDKNTIKGKIIAGLIVSLFIWLSIFFGVSLLMLIGKFVVQSINTDNTRRIAVARAEINTLQDKILKSFDATVSTLTISQLSTLPLTDNKIALQLSYQKIAATRTLLLSLPSSLPRCEVNSGFTGFAPGSTLADCREDITAIERKNITAIEPVSAPKSSNPPQNEEPVSSPKSSNPPQNEEPVSSPKSSNPPQNELLKLLRLELLSLENHQQIDSILLTFSTAVQNTKSDGTSAYSTQIQTARKQIISEIDTLRNSETFLVLIDFFNTLDASLQAKLEGDLKQLTPAATEQSKPDKDANDENATLSSNLRDFYQKVDKSDANSQLTGMSNVFFQWSTDTIYTQHIYRFLLALLAGGIGGIISIFTRIDDIEKQNPSSPFLLGLLQPLIGATFSIVVMLVLSTPAAEVIKILPQELYLRPDIKNSVQQSNDVKKLDSREVYLILIVGFIVGFSERFAKNAFNGISRTP